MEKDATSDVVVEGLSPTPGEKQRSIGAEEIELIQQQAQLTFIEQVKRLPGTPECDDNLGPLSNQPEILVAYLAGEPEAVTAIELLREAQRVWNERKRSHPCLPQSQDQRFLAAPNALDESPAGTTRRYSHDDLRIAYDHISSIKDSVASETRNHHPPTTGSASASGSKANYHRRASSQVESLNASVVPRYQKNPARKRGGSRQEDIPLMTSQQHVKRQSRGSVDQVSLAMNTAGMASRSGSMQSEATEARRPSHHRLHPPLPDEGLLLGAEAASLIQQQRRRASSKASAIFLVSPSIKETQLVPEPEDEDDGTPEGRRRRRTISIIATVGAFLLVLSILLVTVTLRLATHIDDLGKDYDPNRPTVHPP